MLFIKFAINRANLFLSPTQRHRKKLLTDHPQRPRLRPGPHPLLGGRVGRRREEGLPLRPSAKPGGAPLLLLPACRRSLARGDGQAGRGLRRPASPPRRAGLCQRVLWHRGLPQLWRARGDARGGPRRRGIGDETVPGPQRGARRPRGCREGRDFRLVDGRKSW